MAWGARHRMACCGGVVPRAPGLVRAAVGDSAARRPLAPADRGEDQPGAGDAGTNWRDRRAVGPLRCRADAARRRTSRCAASTRVGVAARRGVDLAAFDAGVDRLSRAAARAVADRRRRARCAARRQRAPARRRHRVRRRAIRWRRRRARRLPADSRIRNSWRFAALDRREARCAAARIERGRPRLAQHAAQPQAAARCNSAARRRRALHAARRVHPGAACAARRLAALVGRALPRRTAHRRQPRDACHRPAVRAGSWRRQRAHLVRFEGRRAARRHCRPRAA